MVNITKKTALRAARDFMKFVDASPSPYHVVQECKDRLLCAGFREVKQSSGNWNVKPMEKLFMTKNQTSIIACAVGGNYVSGNGFTMLGAHTDSPCPRLKVVSKRLKEKYLQVGVECYGGGSWPSWFDRDLKIAGRLLVRTDEGKIVTKLINVDRAVMRIPHVAIHCLRTMNTSFKTEKETQFLPIMAMKGEQSKEAKKLEKEAEEKLTGLQKKHHGVLLQMLADEANIELCQLVDFSLYLADHQPSTLGGISEDFIFAPRIDNLLSMYAGLEGLINSCNSDTLACDPNIRMLVGYDHEEVGSRSAEGAGSSFTEFIMRRLSNTQDHVTAFEEAIPKSMLLSADNCHAIHPNYPEYTETTMKVSLEGGPVISTSGSQNYATNDITATIVRELAAKVDLPVQESMGKNGDPAGSTIGPVLAGKLGVKTVDVGASQLSMHSCREMCGVLAPEQCTFLYSTYFDHYPEVNENLESD